MQPCRIGASRYLRRRLPRFRPVRRLVPVPFGQLAVPPVQFPAHLPGDQLVVRIDIIRHSRGIWKVSASGTVDGKVVAEAELMGALRSHA